MCAAFHLVGDDGEGIIEQVDGVIELNRHLVFIVRLLERQDELADFLEKKVQAALLHKNPLFKVLDADREASA